ncbi:sigma-54-dependent Fis family transcriptional regulator [Croceicoccus sediminis]|uniref:sigma-54-dependent Fis family transcriptional regulator n=1 Tax=Croceicoccus sediminis TaxID=2571150 RepID=UPI001183FDB7|nr:helix-turn-helix domain-containing protein [Croceicoccus sediminis]
MQSPVQDLLRSQAERDAIVASWKRCDTQHRLSRDTRRPLLRLQDRELQHSRQSFVDRLSGNFSELQWLSDVSRSAGHFAAIADDQCVLVMHDIGQPAGTDFEQAGISAGSCWTEQIAGTNGLGMALRHRQMLTVMGSEHYFARLSRFVCTSAPIFDQSDEPIGAICISAIDRGDIRDRSFAEHVLRMATGRIQARLFHEKFRDMVRTSVAPARSGMDEYLNALIAVDTDGIIRGATHAAASALGRDSVLPIIGSALGDIIDTSVNQLVGTNGGVLMAESDTGSLTLMPSLPKPRRLASYCHDGPRQPPPSPSHPARLALADLEGGDDDQRAMLRRLRCLFRAGLPLHLCGEPGTGKLSLVRALHFDATLGQSPIITIDAADIAVDGETTRVAHLLEQVRACAAAGPDVPRATLHLRDIAGLSPGVQLQVARLLSDLENSSPSGPEGPGIHVIATGKSSCDPDIIAQLRSHLAGDVVTLMPLSQRRDLKRIVERMRDGVDERHRPISPEAMDALLAYRWPGNFRELRLVLRRASLLSKGGEIMLHDLPDAFFAQGSLAANAPSSPAKDTQVTLFTDALASTNWNVSEAARRCGISRATLHRKIKSLGIMRPGAARLGAIEAGKASG